MPIHTSPQTIKPHVKREEMQSEFHAHGDPLLEAMKKYDQSTGAENKHKQELKQVYDKHAQLLHEERGAGALVGDHLWFYNDIVPKPEDVTKKESDNGGH